MSDGGWQMGDGKGREARDIEDLSRLFRSFKVSQEHQIKVAQS